MEKRSPRPHDQRQGQWVFIPSEPREALYEGGSFVVSQRAIRTLVTDSEIHGECLRVFLYIVTELDFQNWIPVSQTEIAEGLGMKRPNVGRQMTLMESKGVLLRGPKIGRIYTWRLNPEYGWKGNLQSLAAYRRQKAAQ